MRQLVERNIACDDEVDRQLNEFGWTKTQVRSEIETGANKAARVALTEAYRKLIDKLNALLLLNSSAEFETIAQQLNELFDANHAAMKAKKTAKKSVIVGVGKAVVEEQTKRPAIVERLIERGRNRGSFL